MAELTFACSNCDGVVRVSGREDEYGETPMNCDKCGHPFVLKRSGKPYTAMSHAVRIWECAKAQGVPVQENELLPNSGFAVRDVLI